MSTPRTVVILDPDGTGVVEDARDAAVLVLAAVVAASEPGARVLTRRDLEAALSLERQRQLLGCADDESCLTELTDALGADEVVSTHLTTLRRAVAANVRVIEVKRRGRTGLTALGRAVRVACEGDAALLAAVRDAAAESYGASVAPQVSRCVGALSTGLALGGVVALVGAALGLAAGLPTQAMWLRQQSPGEVATVTRREADRATAILWGSGSSLVLGVTALSIGLVGAAAPLPELAVTVSRVEGGGTVTLGGRF